MGFVPNNMQMTLSCLSVRWAYTKTKCAHRYAHHICMCTYQARRNSGKGRRTLSIFPQPDGDTGLCKRTNIKGTNLYTHKHQPNRKNRTWSAAGLSGRNKKEASTASTPERLITVCGSQNYSKYICIWTALRTKGKGLCTHASRSKVFVKKEVSTMAEDRGCVCMCFFF